MLLVLRIIHTIKKNQITNLIDVLTTNRMCNYCKDHFSDPKVTNKESFVEQIIKSLRNYLID